MVNKTNNLNEGLSPKKRGRKKLDDSEKKHIHVVLGSERFEKFRTLKGEFKQNSDVDVVRHCIDKMYNQLTETSIFLRPVLEQQAKLLLQNEYLTSKHLVLDLNDIINEAVYQWIQKNKSEINLHHFPFRQHLNEEEQKVALVFVEKQFNYDKGLTLEDVMDNLKGLDESKVQRILRKFVESGLVTRNKLGSINYYYAPVP